MVNKQTINAAQIAIICATKDRPDKIRNLLESVARLESQPGQILIADGGHNLKPLVKEFAGRINVSCLYCPEPGQILQRNYARGYLAQNIQLVAHVDDDITFEPDAFQEILLFWDKQSKNIDGTIAGVSFNVADMAPPPSSVFRKIFFMSPQPAGTVACSGYARQFLPATHDLSVDWLVGGVTLWSRDVLCANPHPLSFRTRWAVCEDLLFSYPLRHSHKMFVCSKAIAYHNEEYGEMGFDISVFYGVSSVVMRYHFVARHKELSHLAFTWMTIGIILGHSFAGVCGSRRGMGLAFGMLRGLYWIGLSRIRGVDSESLVRRLMDLHVEKPKCQP